MLRKKGKLAALLTAVLTLTITQTDFLHIYAKEADDGPSGRAVGDIAVNSDNFPDQTFLKEIERMDTDGNGTLSASEIQAVTSLSFSRNSGISSLQGIEYLTALETLHVPGNSLTELDVSGNTSLVSLVCDDNFIETLTLGTNPNLTELYCSVNFLSSLDLSGVPNLTTLDCGDNVNLTSLDVSGNPRLQTLNCSNNSMTALNVSSNTELTGLDCSFNSLAELNVENNTKLGELYCQYNALTSLDLANNISLTKVDVSANKLTSLNLDNNAVLTAANFEGAGQNVSLGTIPGDSYDLLSFDPNIDGDKIANTSGASFQGTVMSGYQTGTPAEYDYLCSVQGPALKVTLNFTAQDVTSSITYMDGTAEFSGWTADYAGQQPAFYVEGTGVQLPTADNIAKEGYTFAGWYKNADFTGAPVTEISAADQGDQILYAKFEINTYEVTFLGMDGNPIGNVQTVEHGQSAAAPQAPDVSGYRFTGWSADFSNVTGPLTVTAQYIKTWTVTFVDDDGIVLKTETVDEGAGATAPTVPAKAGYTFAGWDTAYTNITGDTVVTATYAVNQYTVIFTDWNGTVLETQTVAYGAAAAPTVTPARAGYDFIGWDKAFTNVTENLTVTALYKAVPVQATPVTALYEAAPVQASPVTAVKTGDQSNVIPFLAAAGAALILGAGAVVFRNIHRKRK